LIAKFHGGLRVLAADLGLVSIKEDQRKRSQSFALACGISSAQLEALLGELLRPFETL